MRATAKSGKTLPLPARRARLKLERTFDAAEWDAIRLGVIPQEMEDKWFIYEEGGRLFFHRSWTGFCRYEVVFRKTPAGHEVDEAWVNRDPEQCTAMDDTYDARLLSWLIDVLLLKRPAPWPESGLGDEAARQWSHVGRAMLAFDADGSVAEGLERELWGPKDPAKRDGG